jgi:O-acetylserine/cysteine efflux transporter
MHRSHVLLAVLVATIWGINFVVIDAGLDHFPPLLFVALRFTFVAFPAVFLVARPQVGFRWVLIIGTFLGVGQFGFLFVGIDRGMPAGLASLVLQAQALFTVLFAVALLHERPRGRQLAGIAIGALGLAVIALGRASAVPLLAVMLTLAAAASWGVANIATRVARPRNGLRLVVWSSLVPPVPLAVLSLVFEGYDEDRAALAHLDLAGVAALAYIVVFASLVGYGIWNTLLHRYPASTVAPFSLLVPVVGIAAAWLWLGEVPGVAELIGAVAVLVGVLVLSTSPPSAALTTPRHDREADPARFRPDRPHDQGKCSGTGGPVVFGESS